jgi:hypothetical protein
VCFVSELCAERSATNACTGLHVIGSGTEDKDLTRHLVCRKASNRLDYIWGQSTDVFMGDSVGGFLGIRANSATGALGAIC